eukprot:364193-Chlamydomonas_euryale.AAC.4
MLGTVVLFRPLCGAPGVDLYVALQVWSDGGGTCPTRSRSDAPMETCLSALFPPPPPKCSSDKNSSGSSSSGSRAAGNPQRQLQQRRHSAAAAAARGAAVTAAESFQQQQQQRHGTLSEDLFLEQTLCGAGRSAVLQGRHQRRRGRGAARRRRFNNATAAKVRQDGAASTMPHPQQGGKNYATYDDNATTTTASYQLSWLITVTLRRRPRRPRPHLQRARQDHVCHNWHGKGLCVTTLPVRPDGHYSTLPCAKSA